jgi:isopenicillin-N N-acyltransferase-like protein
MRTLHLDTHDGPRARGLAHGEHWRREIGEISDIRLELARSVGGFPDLDAVRRLGDRHLPVLRDFDVDLHDELVGIAEGAGRSAADIVVLNHYTDLRDLGPAGRPNWDDGGCTAVFARTPAGPIFAQTWDMHGSATPYVAMIHLPERDTASGPAPAVWLMSITGCLGMAGMNAAGVSVGINNLRSLDARLGVVWPALVRRMLRERSAEAANGVLLGARIGSGHHYLSTDATSVIGVETSGVEKRTVFRGERDTWVHTNHCFDPDIAAVSEVVPTSTTFTRLALMQGYLVETPADAAAVWKLLGSHEGHPRGICTHLATAENPHAVETCCGILADPTNRRLWAAAGCLHDASPEVFVP